MYTPFENSTTHTAILNIARAPTIQYVFLACIYGFLIFMFYKFGVDAIFTFNLSNEAFLGITEERSHDQFLPRNVFWQLSRRQQWIDTAEGLNFSWKLKFKSSFVSTVL